MLKIIGLIIFIAVTWFSIATAVSLGGIVGVFVGFIIICIGWPIAYGIIEISD